MNDRPGGILEFQLEGDAKREGLVLAQDFVAFLGTVLDVLRKLETERGRKPAINYRVVELEIGSAVIALEPESDEVEDAPEVVADFLEGVAAVRDHRLHLTRFAPATKQAFGELSRPLRASHLRLIKVRSDSIRMELRQDAEGPLSEIVAPEVHSMGALSGYIDAINVHRDPIFFLYPEVGPTRVRCVFDRTLLDEVRAALKCYVTVHGLIEYPETSPFATRVAVDRIDIHPPTSALPSLDSLQGSVPRLTGDLDSVSYVRQYRDAEA